MSKSKTNQTPAVPARKYDYYRMSICALIVCLVMIGMFALNNEVFSSYIAELEE